MGERSIIHGTVDISKDITYKGRQRKSNVSTFTKLSYLINDIMKAMTFICSCYSITFYSSSGMIAQRGAAAQRGMTVPVEARSENTITQRGATAQRGTIVPAEARSKKEYEWASNERRS